MRSLYTPAMDIARPWQDYPRMAFDGFPPAGPKFLRDLTKNNDKAWFDANRKAGYDDALLAPGKALVDELGPKLQALDPDVRFNAKVGGSIFRIHRDVRFSKDKSPYKTHFDMWFWTGEKKGWDASGFFLRLTGKEILIGAGLHVFQKEAMAPYREAVADDVSGKRLEKIVRKLTKDGLVVEGDTYKRVPKPHGSDHPREELLRRKSLSTMFKAPHPEEIGTKKLVPWLVRHYKKTAPLHLWLRDAF